MSTTCVPSGIISLQEDESEVLHNPKTILFESLRETIPMVSRYTDKMFENALSTKKDVDTLAERFLVLVQSYMETVYLPCPELNRKISLIHCGKGCLKYIAKQLKEQGFPISCKTLLDNIYLLENRLAEQHPTIAKYGHNYRRDWRSTHQYEVA